MQQLTVNSLINFLRTSALVIFYYTFSISLTFYNKWMMKSFKFPLFISVVHYLVVFILASLFRYASIVLWKKKRTVIGWHDYIRKIFPPAIASSLDIGLSNWSFMFITVSLYTMSKSSSIIFILFFSLLFKLEKMRPALIIVVGLIAGGLLMFTYESTQFNAFGFFIALTASAVSGIRWTTVQLLMQKEALGLHSPIDTIFHLQPVMALSLLPLFFVIEGPSIAVSKQLWRAPSWHIAGISLLKVFLGACLAFMLSVSEYLLVSNTSGLALAIAGIFKEICTLTIATEFGGDQLNVLNFIGLVICMSGIGVHVYFKALKDSKHGCVCKGTWAAEQISSTFSLCFSLICVKSPSYLSGPSIAVSKQLWRAPSWHIAGISLLKVFLGACLAFMLSVSEYLLVSNTSGLALAIAGIFKEICTLTIATEFGGDQLNVLNFIGLVICMSGIGVHVYFKALKEPKVGEDGNILKNGNDSLSSRNVEYLPMLESNFDEFSDDDDDVVFESTYS
ncbi:solute carrier family 35 member C2-like [Rhopilema esculentum]|uniref:solute carrier family 35 member C2-like n=1 Tax=Rhopilema esculentum TaxID=499914 RepID=UPI0031E48652